MFFSNLVSGRFSPPFQKIWMRFTILLFNPMVQYFIKMVLYHSPQMFHWRRFTQIQLQKPRTLGIGWRIGCCDNLWYSLFMLVFSGSRCGGDSFLSAETFSELNSHRVFWLLDAIDLLKYLFEIYRSSSKSLILFTVHPIFQKRIYFFIWRGFCTCDILSPELTELKTPSTRENKKELTWKEAPLVAPRFLWILGRDPRPHSFR